MKTTAELYLAIGQFDKQAGPYQLRYRWAYEYNIINLIVSEIDVVHYMVRCRSNY